LPPLESWPVADADHLLVTAAVMGGLEDALFASGLPVAALMEKAALALARRLLQQADDLRRRGVLVLVGPGHNGGDGLVVAREFALAGVPVRVWSPFDSHRPLTADHLAHLEWLGVPRLSVAPDPADASLWIDALFGLGQRRPLPPFLERLLRQRDAAAGEVWAVDGPSGLCSDSGRPLGAVAARCSRSFSIGLWKQGFWQDAALPWVGALERVDLGLPLERLAIPLAGLVRGLWPTDDRPGPTPPAMATKHGRGRLRVIAGSSAYPGAARLALEGASATGLGWLEAQLPPPQAALLWQDLPQVVLASAGAPLDRLDALVCGPGLGPEGPLPEDLDALAATLVLDADGLNRLAAGGDACAWLRRRRAPTWITPHQTEFARLFPDLEGLPPLEAAAAASDRSGAWVLLKGARSLVASPHGERWQLAQASPWAARAGLGDVLAGYAGGLAALGQPSAPTLPLLPLAMLRHATAGVLLARGGQGCADPLAVARRLRRAPLATQGGSCPSEDEVLP
jgi:NAD(P)H-hydrate epimerase